MQACVHTNKKTIRGKTVGHGGNNAIEGQTDIFFFTPLDYFGFIYVL